MNAVMKLEFPEMREFLHHSAKYCFSGIVMLHGISLFVC